MYFKSLLLNKLVIVLGKNFWFISNSEMKCNNYVDNSQLTKSENKEKDNQAIILMKQEMKDVKKQVSDLQEIVRMLFAQVKTMESIVKKPSNNDMLEQLKNMEN